MWSSKSTATKAQGWTIPAGWGVRWCHTGIERRPGVRRLWQGDGWIFCSLVDVMETETWVEPFKQACGLNVCNWQANEAWVRNGVQTLRLVPNIYFFTFIVYIATVLYYCDSGGHSVFPLPSSWIDEPLVFTIPVPEPYYPKWPFMFGACFCYFQNFSFMFNLSFVFLFCVQVATGKWKKRSLYCPLDLFSG